MELCNQKQCIRVKVTKALQVCVLILALGIRKQCMDSASGSEVKVEGNGNGLHECMWGYLEGQMIQTYGERKNVKSIRKLRARPIVLAM